MRIELNITWVIWLQVFIWFFSSPSAASCITPICLAEAGHEPEPALIRRFIWCLRTFIGAIHRTFLVSHCNSTILELLRSKLYVPDNCGNPELYNDNFSITGNEIANEIYDVYNYLEKCFEKYSDKTNYSPEYMWFNYLKDKNVEVIKLDFIQNFCRKKE